MMVLVLTAAPTSLRGDITKWLLEISPGVYVGNPSRRVREKLWERVTEHVGTGKAILVHSSDGEQKLAFKLHGHPWQVKDFDGVKLVKRPKTYEITGSEKRSWSIARMSEKAKRPAWRKEFE
ncbi:type I-E CRISPR-associated endoribonuclease Cas2e [Auritidibacter ignavus]|uniref:type I-E CRISPR-associated endoribonuclease Cas2e n=1 Tax=Auritidibacter TaxID=1160973 RepID=UPI000D739897|nr:MULTISPECIES: type I-E CRISPR-associated endoribonuclease Cas2e [Auritidibacter]PXA79276.1 type I-E CRISPR-associated endoribonuclease Cas2 [Auritidibacter sp. NML120779]PXA79355.1 type I-E CRISPR-associated endoribonuclease Cas2 [Auritidibacter sp. NML120636]WGH80914.1 type I-E CRISPR-associated endoribonuclease Cas2e [Auritidibacter ignavus]WGH85530.1 type I-E CRISPR-associated endoribonuclease Cas2e [Auritidibacter ignavus]WGH87817.1 type I-E CRISPR-associated endoribonuclease Cas2e [Aur